MSKSLIYTVNANAQTVTASANTILNLGLPVRRFGCNLASAEGNILVRGCGYYDIIVKVDFSGTATGTATIQLYQDGVPIPGAEIVRSTAADTSYNFVIPTAIRTYGENTVLTVGITGAAGSVTNITAKVIKA